MAAEDVGVSKLFEATLVVNWKNGGMRILKRAKTHKITPWEVPIRMKLKINAPADIDIVAEGEIDIPQKKVKEMFIHAVSDD